MDASWLEAAARNMWSGMQPVAVRRILTGGGKESSGLEIWSLGRMYFVFASANEEKGGLAHSLHK